jgi:hypothetical protein
MVRYWIRIHNIIYLDVAEIFLPAVIPSRGGGVLLPVRRNIRAVCLHINDSRTPRHVNGQCE